MRTEWKQIGQLSFLKVLANLSRRIIAHDDELNPAFINGLRVGGVLLDKGPDQAQQFLLFWSRPATEGGRNILMLHLPSRCHIGFMTSENSP